MAWYAVVFPSLILNYFGQGAFVIARGGNIVEANSRGVPETMNLFYSMVDPVMLYPLLVLATVATIIASQALITGAYSLAEQAVQLGYCPRLTIVHTSQEVMGQIYVPFVNWMLMVACIVLALEFQESARLADAYGVAVIGTMIITTILVFRVMRVCWRWALLPAGAVLLGFLAVDVPFLVGNLDKVATGGWVPLVVGGVLFVLMTTWRRGQMILQDPSITQSFRFPLKHFVREIGETNPNRDTEIAVFMTAAPDMVPAALLQMVERTKVLPGRLVLFHIKSVAVPRVADHFAIEVRDYGQNCFGVTARTGFLEAPDMVRFLKICGQKGLDLDPTKVFFYLSRLTLKLTRQPNLWGWRKALFAFMLQNARSAASYYHLPADRVVELGRIIEF